MSASLPPGGPGDEEEFPEPPRLRALRRMVTALTGVLMLGMVVIAGTVAWRLAGPLSGAVPVTADALTLPEGAEVLGLGGAGVELSVLIRDRDGAERLLIFSRANGALVSSTPVTRRP